MDVELEYDPIEEPWGPAMKEGFTEWGRASFGFLVRMGPIMAIAGFASGLAIQWVSPDVVSEYLGNDLTGIAIAATFGILINVPLLFEIPLVALLLLMGMGEAPAAVLLFTAAAGGPVTFLGPGECDVPAGHRGPCDGDVDAWCGRGRGYFGGGSLPRYR